MIKHIKCDIFKSGADIICHQVNCQGAMNSGVAKQVREKHPKVYLEYTRKCRESKTPSALLGNAQFVGTKEEYRTQYLGIFNLFSQEKYGYDGGRYTDYNALKACLNNMVESLKVPSKITRFTVAFPYLMSCCRGGGDWDVVYKMIEETFENTNIDVLICEYRGD